MLQRSTILALRWLERGSGRGGGGGGFRRVIPFFFTPLFFLTKRLSQFGLFQFVLSPVGRFSGVEFYMSMQDRQG